LHRKTTAGEALPWKDEREYKQAVWFH
jgi:hypothetical protein